MSDVIAWVQLVATLGLLAVTYWYAKTTKAMADSAKKSAEESARATGAAERSAGAAERSAEAALDAASVAQSQIKPEFTGRQVSMAPLDPAEEHVACLRIDSTGDAVVIQKVRVRRAFRMSFDDGKRDVAISDAEMSPAGLDSRLPKRLHYGEHLLVTHPEMRDAHSDPFKRFIVDIEYTFTESGGTGATKELIIDA